MGCGVEVGGVRRELVCGDKCYVGKVAWEVNGMFGKFEVSGIIDVSGM